MNWDETLLLWINQGWQNGLFDVLFVYVSKKVAFSYPLLIILLVYCYRQAGDAGIRLWFALLITVGISDVLGAYLKDWMAMLRPCYEMYPQVRTVGALEPSQCGATLTGMPSNHAMNFFAGTVFIIQATPWRRWHFALFVIAVLVGLSRIYLGKHYPGQVLVGALVGSSVGLLGAWVTCHLNSCLKRRKHPRPSSIPRTLSPFAVHWAA